MEAKTANARAIVLIEGSEFLEASLDMERRTVRQVIIRAGMSKNKRMYSESVLMAAAPLFEGVQTYANHPSRSEMRERPERDVAHLTGWLSGVEYRDGALIATRHFTQNQAGRDVWALVCDVVENRAPSGLLGASINAVGQAYAEDDHVVVEAITAVNSVDDVTTPAAGGGFVEADGESLREQLLEAMSYEEWFESRPDYRKRLQREMKAARQTDAIKAAKAEADRATEALTEAEAQIAELNAALEAARADVVRERQAAMLSEALAGVRLPAGWKNALKTQLENAAPEQWQGIIQTEIEKAKTADAIPRVPVHGAGQRVHEAHTPASSPREQMPRLTEDFAAWKRRTGRL